MANQKLKKRIIFWSIILLSILIVFTMFGLSVIYQTLTQQTQATLVAIPTSTTKAIVSPLQFEVYANKGWQNTNISVSPTDTVTVRYISGKWTGGIGKGHWYDGRGDLVAKYKCVENYDPNMCDEPIPYIYNGTLVGRIGEAVIEIGNYLQFRPREEGELFLRMNDHEEGLYDNEGVLKVEIEINH